MADDPCLISPNLDKSNRLGVGNAVNPNPSEEDKKLVIVKSPNAVNPLVWDYYVSIMLEKILSYYFMLFNIDLEI